jgi:uncharacterized membrane protein YeiH
MIAAVTASVDLPNIAIQTPLWLALLTTAVAAIQGAVIGRQGTHTPLDFVGVFVFALLLGLGGGLARDLLLGNTPVVALRTPWYVVTVAGAVALVLVAGRHVPVSGSLFMLLDALTLGLYAVIGTQYALDFDVSVIGAIVVGMFASLTGGVLVSVVRREIPFIMRPGSPYALLALAGVLVYLLVGMANGAIAAIACVTTVVVLRFVTVRWDVRTRSVPSLDDPGTGPEVT